MVNESPAAVLFNRDGYDVVVTDGYTIITEQSGIIMAGRNGSLAKFITLDGYGNQVVVGSGTAGSPSGGVVTIQGIVGGQAIPVSGNFTNASVSTVATTPPSSATYLGGSVTTTAPVYTNATMDALSLNANGSLRTIVPDDTYNTGTFTATAQTQVFTINEGRFSVSWQFTGTWTGTINFEKSLDGVNWVAMSFFSGTNAVNSTTVNGIFFSSLGSTRNFRVRTSGTWTGTAAWNVSTSYGIKAVAIQDSIPTGTNTIGAVTGSGTFTVNASATVGIVDNAVFTDGTTRIQPVGFILDEVAGTALTENDGAAARIDSKRAQVITIEDSTTRGLRTTVKAASTAAVAADPALVVTVSPNNTVAITASSLPLPTGAATEATLLNTLTTSAFQARINVLGQNIMANSTPVVIASNQSAIPVNQGTSPWIVQDTVGDGYLQSILANQTNGTQHTIVDGYVQTNPNVIVTNFPATQPISGTVTVNQGTSPWVGNITQFGGSNIVTGTGPSGLGIPRVTVSNDSNILATQSGTWTVQQGTPPWTIIGTGSDNTTNSTAKIPALVARANTVAPSWTDGYMVPLSATIGGLLRVDGSAVTQPISAVSLPLPTGAATEATLLNVLTTSAFQARINTLGQKTMANSTPVVIASDQSAIPASQSGTWTVQQGTPPWTITGIASDNTTNSTAKLPVLPAVANTSPPSWTNNNQVPLSTLLTGALRTDVTSWLGSTAPTIGQKTMANSIPVTMASDQVIQLTGIVDNNAFTDGTTRVQPIGYIFDEVAGTALTENDAAAARIDSKRAQVLVIEDGTTRGTRVAVKAASTAPVVGDPSLVVSFSPNSLFGDNTTNTTVKLPVLPARANTSPPSWTDGYQVPLSTLLTGALRTDNTSWLGSTAPTVGQKTAASSIPVTMASDQSPIPVTFSVTGSDTGVSFSIRSLGGGTANTLTIMETTVYTEPATASQRSVASSSANDTAAGTGARSVQITYYDNTGAGPITEILALNGTAAVNTVATNIRFIEKIEVITVGTMGANLGTITLYGSTGATGGTIGTIGIGNLVVGVGDNKTLWAHHYVATGKVAQFSVVVVGIQSGGSGTNGTFFLRAAMPLVTNTSDILVADAVLTIGQFERAFNFNPKVTGFARITAYGIPGTNNSTMTCAFDWSEQ